MSQEESNIYKFAVVPKTSGQTSDDLCPLCFGSGLEIVGDQGARPCECRLKKLKDHLLDRLNIPKRYAECHFHNYKEISESHTAAKTMAYRFSDKYPAVDRGLLLMGTVGLGKTHLAVSILKALSEKGFYSYFCEFGSLLKEIQDSYNPISQNSELQVLAPLFDADVLVLDELGASKPTEWVRDTLSYIINTRYNDKKMTIFTTNYLDERKKHEETLAERVGVRMRSRLYEMCYTVVIEGADYRKNFDRTSAPKKKTTE
jgi:DNA replication protein DnaC